MVPRLALAAAIVAVFACRVRLGLHTGARQAPVGEICRLPRRLRESQYQATDAGFNQKDRVVNGIRWHYGLPEVCYSWRYVLPLLDHKYRLIAIDMKGYGRSDREVPNYDWHRVAKRDPLTGAGQRRGFPRGHGPVSCGRAGDYLLFRAMGQRATDLRVHSINGSVPLPFAGTFMYLLLFVETLLHMLVGRMKPITFSHTAAGRIRELRDAAGSRADERPEFHDVAPDLALRPNAVHLMMFRWGRRSFYVACQCSPKAADHKVRWSAPPK
jgi:hypothetical protein